METKEAAGTNLEKQRQSCVKRTGSRYKLELCSLGMVLLSHDGISYEWINRIVILKRLNRFLSFLFYVYSE